MTFLPQANSYNKFIFHLYKVLKYSQVAMKIHKKDIVDFLDSPGICFSYNHNYLLSQSFS